MHDSSLLTLFDLNRILISIDANPRVHCTVLCQNSCCETGVKRHRKVLGRPVSSAGRVCIPCAEALLSLQRPRVQAWRNNMHDVMHVLLPYFRASSKYLCKILFQLILSWQHDNIWPWLICLSIFITVRSWEFLVACAVIQMKTKQLSAPLFL